MDGQWNSREVDARDVQVAASVQQHARDRAGATAEVENARGGCQGCRKRGPVVREPLPDLQCTGDAAGLAAVLPERGPCVSDARVRRALRSDRP
jgi:hypothetical protein